MGERPTGGNIAVALLANTIAAGAALAALTLTFGSVSGARFNPVVTLGDAPGRRIPWKDAVGYVAVQVSGGICGTVAQRQSRTFVPRAGNTTIRYRGARFVSRMDRDRRGAGPGLRERYE